MSKKLVPNDRKMIKTVKKIKDDTNVADKVKDVVKGLGFAKTETTPELDNVINNLRQSK